MKTARRYGNAPAGFHLALGCLLVLFLALASARKSGAADSPCTCRKGSLGLWTEITVHQRDVRGDLQNALDRAAALGAARLVFALSYCDDRPAGIEKTGTGELSWPATGCRAKLNGPRAWPELIELDCPESLTAVTLPAGFRLDGTVTWRVSGEELNRRWSATVSISREPASCRPE